MNATSSVSSPRSNFQPTGVQQDSKIPPKAEKAAEELVKEAGGPKEAVQALQAVLPKDVGNKLNAVG